jgi:hypothetical protein
MQNINPLVWTSLAIGLAIAIGFCLVLVDTIRQKGRFGINVTLPNCPTCGYYEPLGLHEHLLV